uniref:Ovule protein n=1 Tax=Heterorhabditis bacteriophora TaxID=37862 RepID=A0A1I7XU74_HETBA
MSMFKAMENLKKYRTRKNDYQEQAEPISKTDIQRCDLNHSWLECTYAIHDLSSCICYRCLPIRSSITTANDF